MATVDVNAPQSPAVGDVLVELRAPEGKTPRRLTVESVEALVAFDADGTVSIVAYRVTGPVTGGAES